MLTVVSAHSRITGSAKALGIRGVDYRRGSRDRFRFQRRIYPRYNPRRDSRTADKENNVPAFWSSGSY